MFRRKFLQVLSLLWFAGSSALLVAGCDAASVFSQLVTWAPLGFKALAGIITLINPAAGSALSIAFGLANTLWSNLTAAITNYQNDTSASKATTLGKLIDALDALGSQITSIISNLSSYVSVSPVILMAAQAALSIIETTLSSIASHLSTTAKSAKAARAPVTVNGVTISVTAATSGKDFQNRYNTNMKAAGHTELILH